MLLPEVQAVPAVVVASSAINQVTGPPSALTDSAAEFCSVSVTAVFLVLLGFCLSDVLPAGQFLAWYHLSLSVSVIGL